MSLLALLRDRRGSTALEYGLIASLVIVAALGAIVGAGDAVVQMWTDMSEAVVAALSG